MIYISSRREPRVCATLSHAAACTYVRACMRTSVIRDCRSSSNASDGNGVSSPLPPLPPLSLCPFTSVPFSNGTGENGGICIHTTSHTVRFNISGHGWKLSPETPGRYAQNYRTGRMPPYSRLLIISAVARYKWRKVHSKAIIVENQ